METHPPLTATRSYQRHTAEYAGMSASEVWNEETPVEGLMATATSGEARKATKRSIDNVRDRAHELLLPKLGEKCDGR